MISPALARFYNLVLNALEDRELPLVSWGITDGSLTEHEVLDVIESLLPKAPADVAQMSSQDLLYEFRDRAWLFKVPDTSPAQYRTRLAESVRLAAQLRQLFPWQARDESTPWWQSGKRLVADYRLHTAPRRYPQRNIPAATALKELDSQPGWGAVQHLVAQTQIGARDLARFQVEATAAVTAALQRPHSSGVIVGAGTGSGKTLAFYLPAFAAMAERARPNTFRLHTLALYPRKELLRDQLREALSTARSLQPALLKLGRRPFRLGALYGDTPYRQDDTRLLPGATGRTAWKRTRDGAVCPYLTCPACERGELLWRDADRRSNQERLTCLAPACRATIPHGVLALTRKSQEDTPPDLLFTTTEMLNLNSAGGGLSRLLGWQGGAVPSLVLLDEVHTYSGIHGAQTALLLRRWQHAVRKPVAFVGLSATLRDAAGFFARLVGLRDSRVEYIQPTDDSMDHEGREYALALRGDPIAGSSLLSTSIQTAMLFGRMLDPEEDAALYGSTGFLFTDDLDVTNRFYDDLRDAEGGQNRYGKPGKKPVLAALRAPTRAQHQARYREGQSWDLMEKIGHVLAAGRANHALRIARTSSQDVGVDLQANLTVATASLEVGFNDPRVGLVLQHKAPHDAAAFIQRRGRAGRQRAMRPLTVITLSDYGRDRLAYQAYETLFQPEVPARHLPVHNRFVIKIQGAQSLLDWAGRKIRPSHWWADPRGLLTAPSGGSSSKEKKAAGEALAHLLESLLTTPALQDDLARHLKASLHLTADDVQALLWEEPRSLLLSVVPTALRRLKNDWQVLQDKDPGAEPRAVLPEFVTRTLFDPLNVPEVALILPFAAQPTANTAEQDSADELLPIARALREAVPGRISRRYGHQHDDHRTWLPIPPLGQDTLELDSTLVPVSTAEGRWTPTLTGQEPSDVVVLRPHRLQLSKPDKQVADRSQGFPLWGSQLVVEAGARPLPADIPHPSPWGQRITSVGFATHEAGNPIEVRRMTCGSRFEVSYDGGTTDARTVRYTLNGEPAALGFRLNVDAASFTLAPLDTSHPQVAQYLTSPQWRTLAFFHAVDSDAALSEATNQFQRGWLALVYLTSFSLRGLAENSPAPASIRQLLATGTWRDDLSEILSVLYRDDPATSPAQSNERLIATLTELSQQPVVIDALDRAGHLLVASDIAQRTADLARRTYTDTMAAAILSAALRACPDAQDGDLIVDVELPAHSHNAAAIWLSETSIGGLGVIEQLSQHYAEDPRRFWRLVESALTPNDYEYVDSTVTRLLHHVTTQPNGKAARAMAALRAHTSAAESNQALTTLREAWSDIDGPPRHSAVAALSTRLLRPGSTPATDASTLALVEGWRSLEQRLGVEVDARVIAYAVGSGRMPTGPGPRLSADQAFSLLWPRGRDARNHHLQHYQPYLDRPASLDRLLATAAHDEQLPHIGVTEEGWEERYQTALAQHAAAVLTADTQATTALADAIVRVPALPIDRDAMRVHGEMQSMSRHGQQWHVRVDIREATQ
ncbi:DEAD/DEAH box helicase [Streptomyces albidoflavus]|uniref:protein DpdJ n=3 Tax=Streptomyces albidoflavus TaxID=1886 RepID=UPI000BAE5785|nr:protein DpdJ [Streptomyces albidoflavus]PAX88411.1 DEAD/DEAH box helicase [Streptomyces albidoflavus]PAX90894.1 DEAD/DEAH box helicase [Streptomyces albidoflavus]PBO23173.1 DEAD/DEAH box helicase [Streptomyces albidoflavus]PBO28591.1 DEAD/DEAH box helicase [Streptomyces albidoflavus]